MVEEEFLELFIDETRDYVSKLNELLVKVSKGDKEAIKEAFRLMHSIKGNAAMVGLTKISELAHKAEDVLAMVRDSKLSIDDKLMKELFNALDAISSALDSLEKSSKLSDDVETKLEEVASKLEGIKHKEEVDKLKSKADEALNFLRNFANKLDELRDVKEALTEISSSLGSVTEAMSKELTSEGTEGTKGEAKVSNQLTTSVSKETKVGPDYSKIYKLNDTELERAATAIKKGLQLYLVKLVFKDSSPMVVLRYFTALSKLGELGEIIKTVPSGNEISEVRAREVLVLMAIRKLSELDEKIKEIPDLESYDVSKVKPEDVGINEEILDTLSPTGEVDRLAALEDLLKKVEEGIEESKPVSEERGEGTSHKMEKVRVSVKSLDKLFNLVGELVLIKSRLTDIATKYDVPGLREALATFSRLVSELQDEVMRMRLVPLQYLYRTIPRLVTEFSSKYGKDVDVYLEGEDISLDRKVLEELANPLYTLIEVLIRDDIEKPEERAKKGKPNVATLQVRASREGNHVVITVESDGRGIDVEEVKRRAVELGLVPSSAIEKMSDDEALMLVTMPGFSLKNGAYSGLDAVKRSIESLGGSLEIYTTLDSETKFVIKIPVSMATLRALLIRLGNEVFAVPVSTVVTTIKVNSEDFVGSLKVIKYQDSVIPLYDLMEFLGLSDGSSRKYAVVVEKRGKLVALAVDEILGQDDVVVKPLGKVLASIKGISGATIIGGGKVCLILDVQSLIP